MGRHKFNQNDARNAANQQLRNNRNYEKQNKHNSKPPKIYKGKNVDPMSNPRTMAQYAIKTFKDMSHGVCRQNGNYSEFADQGFLNAAIKEVQDKMREEHLIIYALESTYCTNQVGNINMAMDRQVQYMLSRHRKSYEGWSFINNELGFIYQSGDMSHVLALINRLPDYAHVLH